MKKLLLLIFITLAAAFTPIFAKVTVNEISPLSLGFLRFGTAAILFYITLKIRRANLKFEKKDYLMLTVLGLLCIPINQFFFLSGIKLTYASHSGIIYSLNPVFAYITAALRKTEKFYISKLLAILLTVTGIIFVFYEGLTKSTAGSTTLSGDFLLIFAVLSFSLYITIGKEYIDKYGPLKVSTYVFLSGTLFNLPVFLFDIHNLDWSLLTLKGIIGFLYLSVIVAFIAYFAWYYALKTIKVSLLTTLSNMSPVLTVAFSIILLGEGISIYFIIGGIITFIGVFIMHKISLELG